MTKFHNLKYSLIAFIIFSIITPMVLSQAKISDGADFYILYWLFSVLALIPANIAYRKGSLEVGKDSDIAIFDKDLNCLMTIVEGSMKHNSNF